MDTQGRNGHPTPYQRRTRRHHVRLGVVSRRVLKAVLIGVSLALITACPQNVFFGVEADFTDEEGPEIEIISPDDGQILSGRVLVTGTATDRSLVELVEVRVNDRSFREATGTNNWSYRLETFDLSEGEHTITVRAVDEFGNDSTREITIVVDRDVPSVDINVDFNAYENYVSGTDVVLTGEARDNNAVDEVEISFDGGVTYRRADLNSAGSDNGDRVYEWSYTIDDTAGIIPGDGAAEVRLRVTDNADLIGTTGFTLFVDNTPPEVTIGSPAGDTNIDVDEISNALVVSGTQSDDDGVPSPEAHRVEVELFILAEDNGEEVVVSLGVFEADISEGVFERTIDLEDMSAGGDIDYGSVDELDGLDELRNHGRARIDASAFDRAGNSADDAVTVSFNADPPEIGETITYDENSGETDVVLDGDLEARKNNFVNETITVRGEAKLGADDDGNIIGEWKLVDADGTDVFGYTEIDTFADAEDGTEFNWTEFEEWTQEIDFGGQTPNGAVYPEGVFDLVFRFSSEELGGIASTHRSIRIDRTAPEIAISEPAEDTIAKDSTVSVRGTVDNGGVSLHELQFTVYEVDGGEPGDSVYGPIDLTAPDEEFFYQWDTEEADSGDGLDPEKEYVLEIRAEDLAGNEASAEHTVAVSDDIPSVFFDEFEHSSNEDFTGTFAAPTVYIDGSATVVGRVALSGDFTIFEELRVGLRAAGGGFVAETVETYRSADVTETENANEYEWEYDLPGLAEGGHTLLVEMTAGEVGGDATILGSAARDIVVDNTPPALDGDLWFSPDEPYLYGVVELSGVAVDIRAGIESVRVGVNAEENGGDTPDAELESFDDLGGASSYEFTLEWDTQQNPGGTDIAGDFEVLVDMVDRAGNRAIEHFPAPVRPFIESVSSESAYLGQTGITVSGYNLYASGTDPAVSVTVGGTGMEIGTGVSANELTFDVPESSPDAASGPIVISLNSVDNAEQEPVRLELFEVIGRDVDDLRSSFQVARDADGEFSAAFATRQFASARSVGYYNLDSSGPAREAASAAVGGDFDFVRIVAGGDVGSVSHFVTHQRDSLQLSASSDGFGGDIVTVELSGGGDWNDLVVDGDDRVHVVYNDDGLNYVDYEYDGDASTLTEVGDSAAVISNTAAEWIRLSADPSDSDRLHLVYSIEGEQTIEYRTFDGTGWSDAGTVSDSFAGEDGIGLAVGPDGSVHVSFYNSLSGDLQYATASGHANAVSGNFTVETIDSGANTGKFSSIVVADDGGVHITSLEDSRNRARYLLKPAGAEAFEDGITVPWHTDADLDKQSTSTLIDAEGNIRSFFADTEGRIIDARYLPGE